MTRFDKALNIRNKLINEGFCKITFDSDVPGQLFPSRFDSQFLDELSNDMINRGVISTSDVFRTSDGDVKQIQSLINYDGFKVFNKLCAKTLMLDEDEYEVLNNQYFCKPPGYKKTAAHQDNAYFDSDETIVTFWMPLMPVNSENGTLHYLAKSNKLGLLEHQPTGTNIRTRTGTTGVSLYLPTVNEDMFIPMDLKLGQMVVHDKNSIHFASENKTDEYRVAVTCIMKILD